MSDGVSSRSPFLLSIALSVAEDLVKASRRCSLPGTGGREDWSSQFAGIVPHVGQLALFAKVIRPVTFALGESHRSNRLPYPVVEHLYRT
jgi:hypothetical protein